MLANQVWPSKATRAHTSQTPTTTSVIDSHLPSGRSRLPNPQQQLSAAPSTSGASPSARSSAHQHHLPPAAFAPSRAAMTEARLENPNSRGPAKLNPAAKSFVFNTAAPVWTPSFAAAPAAAQPMRSPVLAPASAPVAVVASPAPKLKAKAKPFVPSGTQSC